MDLWVIKVRRCQNAFLFFYYFYPQLEDGSRSARYLRTLRIGETDVYGTTPQEVLVEENKQPTGWVFIYSFSNTAICPPLQFAVYI